MGLAAKPYKAKLIVAILFSQREWLDCALIKLENTFGCVDFRGKEFYFGFTDYYTREMGPATTKVIYSFRDLIQKDRLAEIKVITNKIENSLLKAPEGGRTVNIDPGYITDSKLVLATTKNYSHRIYLSDGIFAEVTLTYRKKEGFVPQPWTYSDFKTQHVINECGEIRSIYLHQRRHETEIQGK